MGIGSRQNIEIPYREVFCFNIHTWALEPKMLKYVASLFLILWVLSGMDEHIG